MATETNPSALTDSLTIAIADTREDINSIEAGIQDLELSIPEYGSIEFRLVSNREAWMGTSLQINMDQEYLALRQSDLRRLERTQRARARAA